jgi:broad specificity phosphatase PhoE
VARPRRILTGFLTSKSNLTLCPAIIGVKASTHFISPVRQLRSQIIANARITLISHAATSAQRRSAFPLDEPVDDRELEKIAALTWRPTRAQQIYAAPERRTQQTAQALGLSAISEAQLRDCNYGEWCGRDLNDLQEETPEGVAAWLTDPHSAPHGGESTFDLIERIATWLDAQRDSGHTIAVTHPAVIRSTIIHTLSAPAQSFWRIDIAPLTITDLRYNGRAWTIRSSATPLSQHEIDTV